MTTSHYRMTIRTKAGSSVTIDSESEQGVRVLGRSVWRELGGSQRISRVWIRDMVRKQTAVLFPKKAR